MAIKKGQNLKKLYKFIKNAQSLKMAGLDEPHKRQEMAEEIIASTSRQNAAVAAAFFVPGSDMPILTLNQMKMVIELAALYDRKLSLDRAKELAATFGSGYLFRGAARQLLGLIPGPGFAIKAGVAFGGTKALGKAAQKYFEKQMMAMPAGRQVNS